MGPVRARKRQAKVMGCAVLLSLFLLLPAVLHVGVQAEEGTGGEEEYVRKIDEGPSLAEMEKGPGWSYNADYIYAISRALRDSSLPAAAKVPLFIPSIVLDTGLLPFSLIAGLFGD